MAIPLIKRDEKIKGGAIVARILAAEGVDTVFGIVDGTYIGFFAAFAANGMRLVTPRHETSAAHMAGAYARLTGKLGVCMASNGPGVANVLPGVAVENAEGNRVLLITSCRREGIVYPDRGGAYQYFPQVEVTAPMTKWSCAVPSGDRLAEVMRRALRIAWTGRPGVVHVDVPESIMNGAFELDPSWFREPETYRVTAPITPAPDRVDAALRLLAEAKRPLIHAGSGVLHAGATAELAAVAEALGAPVTTSWGARAAIDERRPESVPMCYVDAVNKARTEADLVLVLGSRLGETDFWSKPPYWGRPGEQKIIQVDIDAEHLGNIRSADLPILADARVFLGGLLEALKSRGAGKLMAGRKKWLGELSKACAARRKKLDKHLSDMAPPMVSAHVPVAVDRVFDDDDVLVVDGGNTAVWTHFYHQNRGINGLLQTAKMGMLGAGMSQALGAQIAFPNKRVVCVIGDGAAGFHIQEIESAVRNGLPVIYIVLCDRQWGMVKMTQQIAFKPIKTLIKKSLGPDETINADLGEIEFDEVARAMGAHGERVSDPSELVEVLERARDAGRCAVVHVDVDPVKHMWAPNLKTFKDMHQEPKG